MKFRIIRTKTASCGLKAIIIFGLFSLIADNNLKKLDRVYFLSNTLKITLGFMIIFWFGLIKDQSCTS